MASIDGQDLVAERRPIAVLLVSATTIFVAVGTYYFTVDHWGLRILARIIGGSV